ncbi:unnamed protein product [Pieris macdunnoughi]|uniref:Protein borderless n=1 Tax=Pieris macdunnoughi TaxID=345717 RepID=A0A821VEH9_9NEOP|nr:unnamed protein product [Pieris macdunnoughi]
MWRLWALCTAFMCARGALLPLEVERLRASVGGYAVMNCHLDFPFGNEIPYHLQWDKDGETIFSWYSGDASPRVADRWGGRVRRVGPGAPTENGEAAPSALGGGSVNVSSVRETDAGLYRCLVTFPNRTPPSRNNGTYYYLDVEGGNLIVTPPVNVTVIEGDSAELECLVKSPEWSVQWYREDVSVSALPELAARTSLAPNGSLLLRRAISSDLGRYECRVSAPDGRRQAAAAHLDVHYKAKVVYSPAERHLGYGKPASLDCHFSANPPLTNLRWEKDGFLFDPYNVPGVFYSRNGSLLFNKVDESHEGVYSCTPYNTLGSAGPSAGVRVRVQRPPALAIRPRPLYLARLAGHITLPCVAEPQLAAVPPSLSWARKDGHPLPAGRHTLDGGNLTITDVREEDRGSYVCTLTNEAAAVSAETELVVENVAPRAPHDLRARAEASAVHVQWAADRADLEYQVWWRERSRGEWRTMKILTRGDTHATLRGLRPATPYELRVLAQDQLGDGLFSQPLFVTTPDLEASGMSEASEEVATALPVSEVTEEMEEALEVEGVAELEVRVSIVEEGALVRWEPHVTAERCTVRWFRDEHPRRLLALAHTTHDHLLVGAVEEGGAYWAQVQCAAAWGGASAHVPHYGRLRAAALGVGVAALLLGAAAATAWLLRRRFIRRPVRDKRSR